MLRCDGFWPQEAEGEAQRTKSRKQPDEKRTHGYALVGRSGRKRRRDFKSICTEMRDPNRLRATLHACGTWEKRDEAGFVGESDQRSKSGILSGSESHFPI